MIDGVLAVPGGPARGACAPAPTSPSPPTPSPPPPPTPRARPRSTARAARTSRQHLDVARLIADAVREETGVEHPWQLVYQSRSGAPHIPWLEPDICDHLEDLHAAGRARGRDGPHRLRLGPHGGPVRPRHRGHREGRRAGPARARARRPSAPTRGSPRRCATWSWSAPRPSGRVPAERCALGALGPSHDLCPVGCCPARAPEARGRRRRQPVRLRKPASTDRAL